MSGVRRSARTVTWSVPGARPRPRSILPGAAPPGSRTFGDYERSVVGQHDAAGADAAGGGGTGQVAIRTAACSWPPWASRDLRHHNRRVFVSLHLLSDLHRLPQGLGRG